MVKNKRGQPVIVFLLPLQAQEKMDGVGTESQEGLALAAADHVWDIGQTGTASHSSSDGTTAVTWIRLSVVFFTRSYSSVFYCQEHEPS